MTGHRTPVKRWVSEPAQLGDLQERSALVRTAGQEADFKAHHTMDTPANQKHGTLNAYHCGCRCDLCRAVAAEANRAYRARKKARSQPMRFSERSHD